MHGGRGTGPDRRIGPLEKRLLLLGGLSSMLLLVGSLIVLGMVTGVPVMAADNPAPVAVTASAFAGTGLPTAAPGDILPVLATPTATVSVATPPPEVSKPAPQSPVATAPAGPTSAETLPRAEFAISPQIGPPGSEITVTGQGWAPSDLVAIRLQDPARPQVTSEALPLATADTHGSFRTSLALPVAPPWVNLPAVVLWAVSSKTGIYAASPQPFVQVVQPLKPPSGPAEAVTALQATTTATSSPPSQVAQPQSPLPTSPFEPPGPPPFAVESPTSPPANVESVTPQPTSNLLPQAGAEASTITPEGVLETPLPEATVEGTIETPLPEVGVEPLAAATPEGMLETPLPEAGAEALTSTPEVTLESPLPTPTVRPSPTATLPSGTAPNGLPRTGGSVLADATVTSGDEALRAGPGAGYRAVFYLSQGSSLAIMGQTSAGEWLWVKTGEGAQGWVPRVATDFAGKAPLAPGQH